MLVASIDRSDWGLSGSIAYAREGLAEGILDHARG